MKKPAPKPAWARAISMTFLYRTILFLAWLFFKVLYRHRVYGLEHYYEKDAIIAGNHASFYDPPILAISWPQEVHFLARETLFRNRFFGGLIRSLNSHPVSGDAGDIATFKTICQLLKEGKKIILFPEGKRSATGSLGPLKPGIALLTARAQSAVIPAYIHGTFNIWNRNRKWPKLWGKTACVFGSAIRWEEFSHLPKREAQEALTERLRESIESLRVWYEGGRKGPSP